jgi:hypothetical protein
MADHRYPTRLALYLALIQFFLLISWTVYAVYLPTLLESVGIERRWTTWVLLVDQVIFACFDVLAGFLAARAFRLYARIGPVVIAVTAVSSIAFLALPWLPMIGTNAVFFLSILALWAIGSAALRSPVFALLARHASAPAIPGLAALALFGMGLAAAVSPYLGLLLKGQDPRWPFLLASLALWLAATGLVVAERRTPSVPPESQPPVDKPRLPVAGWLMALLLAAVAVQITAFLYSGLRYSRELGTDWLPWLLPLFWVAFSLVSFPVKRLVKRWGPEWLFLSGSLLGGTGLLVAMLPGLTAALTGFTLAGLGWGLVLPSAFGFAAASGHTDRTALHMGLLFAALAVATLLRIGIMLSGWSAQTAVMSIIVWVAALSWLLAAFLIAGLLGFGRRNTRT